MNCVPLISFSTNESLKRIYRTSEALNARTWSTFRRICKQVLILQKLISLLLIRLPLPFELSGLL
jgi:hypothetical protein